MPRIVQKYGGSSVATTEKIIDIAKNIILEKEKGNDLVIVVSAMGKTTDNLISLSKEITDKPDLRELDRLMSTGEQITISLMTIALKNLGHNAVSLTGEQAGIKTEGFHTKTQIKDIHTEQIEKHLNEGNIVIVAGFQGVNERGDITTLGRGGSDTSAVALAAALKAKCEIYTDVDGIYSIDPRVYSKAKKLNMISYDEMMELAFLGAGIMEPRSVELSNKFGVEVYVGKTLGEKNGTIICAKEKIMEKRLITGISLDDNVIMVDIENIPTYANNVYFIFKSVENYGVNVDMISQNDISAENGSIAFTCLKTDKVGLEQALEEVKKEFNNIKIKQSEDVAKISLVGIGMVSGVGVASRVFKVLAEKNLSFHQISTSEISISIIVDVENKELVARSLAEEFEI